MEDLSRFGPVCARQVSAAAEVVGRLRGVGGGLQSCQNSSPSLTLRLEKGRMKRKSSLMRGVIIGFVESLSILKRAACQGL